MDETDDKWITAYIDVSAEHLSAVEARFKKFNIDQYMIACETEPRDHMHLIGYTDRRNWDAMMRKLVDKFNLRTKTRGGHRKYKTLNEPTRNIELLRQYCTKEGNLELIRTNLKPEEVEAYYEKSYKKNKDQKENEQAVEHLENTIEQPFYSQDEELYYEDAQKFISKIKLLIINYLRTTHDIIVSKHRLMKIFDLWLLRTNKLCSNYLDKLILYSR